MITKLKIAKVLSTKLSRIYYVRIVPTVNFILIRKNARFTLYFLIIQIYFAETALLPLTKKK